jgi:hypothetical protein
MKTHLIKNTSTYCGLPVTIGWGLQTTTDKDLVTCKICTAFTSHKKWDEVFYARNNVDNKTTAPRSRNR